MNSIKIKVNIALIFLYSISYSAISQEKGTSLPYYNSGEFTPHWLTPDSPELNNFHRISDFKFINQDAQTVTSKTFSNKLYVANFFFTRCPGICPKMKSQLYKVQQKFKANDNVMILSHSIQPSNDTVEILKDYALKNNVMSQKWHLVTGIRDEIYSIARNDYFANEDLGEYVSNQDFLHTENLILVDNNRRIRGIYNGLNKTSVSHLMVDIELLLTEMSAEQN